MKVKPGKAKQPTVASSKIKPKAVKVAAKASPTRTTAKKAVAAKPVVKPTAKLAAKPAPKAAVKPVAKAVARPPVKAVARSAAKTGLPGAKVPGTKLPPTSPAPAPKPAARPSAPPAAGAASSVTKAKGGAIPEVNVQAKSPAKPESLAVPSAPVTVSAVAQRAGRPSSRLASLTVPSMAQSVASTAAKASYSQVTTVPLIVPPLPSATKKDPKLANNWKTKPVDQLSDAELMAMPDSEYMNDKQMAAFRLKLTTLKQEILNSAGETTEHLREDTVVVPDPADRATIEEEHALELRTRDRERKLLKKIEQSIGRIDAGDYGYCDETGDPIGVGRLLARPTATLSLEAQQRRELKQKMFGD